MKKKLIILTLILSMFTLAGCTQKKDTPTPNSTNISNNSSNISTDSGITADKAKEIALTQVPGAALEHIVEFKSETDDNRPVYDGKIHYNGQEYDFEIDATTGDILEWDVENIK